MSSRPGEIAHQIESIDAEAVFAATRAIRRSRVRRAGCGRSTSASLENAVWFTPDGVMNPDSSPKRLIALEC
jgi:hypothetical protein